MNLINVRPGDRIKAGQGFQGPHKFFKVTQIEWASETSLRVHTEGGIYEGNPYSQPGVIRDEGGRRVGY